MNNEQLILEAIRTRSTITFYYKGGDRTVEPFTLGHHATTDNLILRGFFLDGYSSSGEYNNWKMYVVADMENISLTDNRFSGQRAGYNPQDKAMSTIIAHV